MPSQAFKNLSNRMNDVEQLMQAHDALTQFKKARKAAAGSGQLSKIAQIVNALVNQPGRGRRSEVDALNRASIVLLSAHLQGYIEDVYAEAGEFLLANHVKDIQALLESAKKDFSNPHDFRIDKLFNSIGISSIMSGISWQRASNKSIRKRLTDYVRLRNRIAHGEQENVSKAKVTSFKNFVEVFVKKLDDKISSEIYSISGRRPW